MFLTNSRNPCVVDPDRHGLPRDLELWPAVKVNCKEDIAHFNLQPDDAVDSVLVPSDSAARRWQNPLVADRVKTYLPHMLGLSWDWEHATTNTGLQLQGPREIL
ncbi:hypothetical protein PGQ11_001782 [Apiospora arundinis]|uniref:Uncharacterized protein n=1 Tax=Apiospora arundinis TaxID=335852 RepID=A0ABR2JH29_9PEZI